VGRLLVHVVPPGSSVLYNGTRSLFEQAGFTYSRPKGIHHCVMTATVAPATC
jgi:hypothetical protein